MNADYKVLLPEDFSHEHIKFIESFRNHVSTASEFGLIFGAKDINSRHIIATDSYANIIGLKHGNDVGGMFDKDMPCEGTAQYAESYVKEDLSLINALDITKNISVLNIHNYSDGLKARIFKKRLLFHKESCSILGTIYSGHDIELKNIFNLIPRYIAEFKKKNILIGSNNISDQLLELEEYQKFITFIEKVHLDIQSYKIQSLNNKIGTWSVARNHDNLIKLSKREKEVLYLLSFGKSPKEITKILSKLELKNLAPSTIAGVINKQLFIKLGVTNVSQLIEKAYLLKLIPVFLKDFMM